MDRGLAVLEIALVAGVFVLAAAFRWGSPDGINESSPGRRFALLHALGARVRLLGLPLLVGAALHDWKPTIVRHAPNEWLFARATDESSSFREASVLELVERLAAAIDTGNDVGRDALIAGMWQISIEGNVALGPAEPLKLSVALAGPELPITFREPLPNRLGTFEWELVSASIDDAPLLTCGRPRATRTDVTWRTVWTEQTLDVSGATPGQGTSTLRTHIALSYRGPDGERVGPTVSKFAQQRIRFY